MTIRATIAARRRLILGTILATTLLAVTFPTRGADEAPPESAGARYANDVRSALGPLLQQYGPDAINLQGNLLRYAIDNGSLLDAAVGVAGPEDREGVQHLIFRLDTGMVFPPDAHATNGPAARLWADVLNPAFRHCKRLQTVASRIEIQASYHRSAFSDRTDLARKLRAGQVTTEHAVYRFSTDAIVKFANGDLDAAALLADARIESNGQRVDVHPAPAATTTPTFHSRPNADSP